MNDTQPNATVEVTPKNWWESKVVWINALTMLAALLMFLSTSQAAGELPFDLDSRWVIFLLGLINFALRFVTSAPVMGAK